MSSYQKKKQQQKTVSEKVFNYNSKNGFITKTWGPALWHVLHTISFNYPVKPTEENKNDYMNFIYILTKVLPCGACRENLKKNLKNTKFSRKVMKNRESFSKWVYQLHKHVNNMLNTPTPVTYKQVRHVYEHFRAQCVKKTTDPKVEKGCVDPAYHVKAKCIITIVPQDMETHSSIIIHPQCLPYGSRIGNH